MYGAQTCQICITTGFLSENDVEMYGAQTIQMDAAFTSEFENDVEK